MPQVFSRKRLTALLSAVGRWMAITTGALSATFLAGTFCVVMLGVISRYVVRSPLQWTEEMARFLMLWTGFMAINVAMYHRQHLAIDAVIALLPQRVVKILGYISDILIAYFLIILLNKGYAMTTRTIMKASSIEVSMFWIYSAVPLGALLTLIQHVLQVLVKLLEPLELQT